MKNVRPRLAVDIGGTFTDIAIEVKGQIESAKVLTTHGDPVEGVMAGIGSAMSRIGLEAEEIGSVIHGTTLATNALIERRGAKVGAIVTDGFQDILEIGYERRYDQYDLNIEKQDFLVPRDLMFSADERLDVSGAVLKPLDASSVELAVKAALEADVESIAVCLLHSYKSGDHEREVRDIISRIAPQLSVTLSCEASPEIREFDRLCTTVCNAYIKPLMARYLEDLKSSLKISGFDCPLFIMTSGGGMTTLETAKDFPIRLVESGPSGGAILAARVAAERGIHNTVSFDMGGTTAKICLIDNQKPKSSRTFEIDRAARFLKGSGIPVRIPVIEMIEIGAGGGSIASVDGLGRLRVGPKSASSEPGPACYARGGTQPTVTDADLAIGYINPAGFAEGRLDLEPELSTKAIETQIGQFLGLEPVAAADAISQTVDEAMSNAARIHSVEQGKDISKYTMIAFGGNGPLHAGRIAEKLGIREIVIPANPSVGSAVGFLFAPVSYEIVRTLPAHSTRFPFREVNTMLAEMQAEAQKIVNLGAPGSEITTHRMAFMRYDGQGHEIEIPIPDGEIDEPCLSSLINEFENEYRRQFGRVVPTMKVEVMNWSVMASNKPSSALHVDDQNRKQNVAPTGNRSLHLGDSGGTVAADTYNRETLKPGDTLNGPALIVEPQTTSYVPAGFSARIDSASNIVITGQDNAKDCTAESGQSTFSIARQIMWDRLISIVEEQGQVLVRTAFSPIVRECGDISAGVFDLEGNMLAQAVTGTPGHINTMAESVKLMLPHMRQEEINAGDIFITNDPWIGSGHLNDLLLVAPIYYDNELVAYTACTSHVYDLGGLGMGPNGSDVFDEGLFVPPWKLADRGEVNQLLVEMIKANSRSPVANEGDVYALMACCDVASIRVSEMIREFGMANFVELGQHIIDTSRKATQSAISAIPPGTYHGELKVDGYDFETVMHAALAISDTEIVVDFTGTSGHSRFGINCPINYTAAYGVFALRCLIGSDIPNNAGSLEPFKFIAPEDCILNAQSPAPVAMRHTSGQMVADLMFDAISKAVENLAPAEGSTCLWDIPIRSAASSALASNRFTQFATEFTHSGGTGARPTKDGLSATAFPSGVFGTQAEIAESTVPVRYLRRELIMDSGGAGKFRGGLGQYIEVESSENAPMLLLAGVERTKYPARGRAGGQNGSLGQISLRSGSVLASKGEHEIPAGDLLLWKAPGGAGFGDPLERDPEMVARDVREKMVSPEAALNIYGVILNSSGKPDLDATNKQRSKKIRNR